MEQRVRSEENTGDVEEDVSTRIHTVLNGVGKRNRSTRKSQRTSDRVSQFKSPNLYLYDVWLFHMWYATKLQGSEKIYSY